jgi:hypothetical protein
MREKRIKHQEYQKYFNNIRTIREKNQKSVYKVSMNKIVIK